MDKDKRKRQQAAWRRRGSKYRGPGRPSKSVPFFEDKKRFEYAASLALQGAPLMISAHDAAKLAAATVGSNLPLRIKTDSNGSFVFDQRGNVALSGGYRGDIQKRSEYLVRSQRTHLKTLSEQERAWVEQSVFELQKLVRDALQGGNVFPHIERLEQLGWESVLQSVIQRLQALPHIDGRE